MVLFQSSLSADLEEISALKLIGNWFWIQWGLMHHSESSCI